MVVVGSGIYGETLAAGNTAVALLANSIATGAGLYVLITLLGPLSGAHFNPAVTLLACLQRELPASTGLRYVLAQCAGGVVGVWLTHLMFALPALQSSAHARTGAGQWLSEWIATVLLLATIQLGRRHTPDRLPLLIALLVTAGYWFTASTFFANPAVTLARSLTDTFAGIRAADVIGFVAIQLGAAVMFPLLLRFFSPPAGTD